MLPDAPTNLKAVIDAGRVMIPTMLIMTPVLIGIMLGAYLICLTLWDAINARIEIKRAVKEYKKNYSDYDF